METTEINVVLKDSHKYLYSVKIDYYKQFEGEKSEIFLDYVYELIKDDIVGRKDKDKCRYIGSINAVVSNAYFTTKYDDSLFIAYSRDRNTYNYMRERLELDITYIYFVRSMDALVKNGLILHKKGINFPKYRKMSRFKGENHLAKLVEDHGLTVSDITCPRPPIVVKNLEKEVIQNPGGKLVAKLTKNLFMINSTLASARVSLELNEEERDEILKKSKLDLSPMMYNPEQYYLFDQNRTALYRVFNDCSLKFDTKASSKNLVGGRFYGHYAQCVSKELRKKIKINGENVCELDYSGLHIRMLYDFEKIRYSKSKDVYSLKRDEVYIFKRKYPSTSFRNHFKLILLTMINADNRDAAIKSLLRAFNNRHKGYNIIKSNIKVYKDDYFWLDHELDKDQGTEDVDYIYQNKYVKFRIPHVEMLVDTFISLHKRISKYFFSG